VPGLTAGQCFDIDISPEVSGWVIRIPEIGGVTHASRRIADEVVARKYIAARTGIPVGYVTVNVRD
jgi:dienelactone hydrolase